MTQSSKNLFRAMKRKHAAHPSFAMELPDQMKPEAPRRSEDFYPTGQPEAMRGLLAHDGNLIRRCGAVWEPACGDGALVKVMRDVGISVIASDLIDRGCPNSWQADFLTMKRSEGGAIITNPPYNLINARDGHGRWLRHTLEMPGWTYCALLLSWDWPAARANGLGALLDAHPFSYCYLMRWKLDFTGEGSPPQRNAWFIWRRDWRGPPMQMRFMNREDGNQIDQGSLSL